MFTVRKANKKVVEIYSQLRELAAKAAREDIDQACIDLECQEGNVSIEDVLATSEAYQEVLEKLDRLLDEAQEREEEMRR